MTIAVSLKVQEGVVLASDSASTLTAVGNAQSQVVNDYDHANKIVNLHKGLPLGIVTWGGGSIGPVSVTTIFKDIRAMLCGDVKAPGGADWSIDPNAYEVYDVACRVREHMYEGLYLTQFDGLANPPEIGIIVAGFSSGGQHAEEFQLNLTGDGCPLPQQIRLGPECGLTVGGQTEAIARLIFGVDPRMSAILHTDLGRV